MTAHLSYYNSSNKGSTLVEAIVAAGVLIVAVAGITLTCWKTINLLRLNKAECAATACMEERVEQMRNSSWAQITSGTYIQSCLNTQPSAAASIPGYTEELSVNAYPTATTAIDVTASTAGAASINTNNAALASGTSGAMVKIDVTVTWPNYYGPTHQRTVTTVISNGGITR